jgi:HEAT repeat protein
VTGPRPAQAACLAVLLLCATAAFGADEVKTRVKTVKDLAKQGATAIPQLTGYLSDPEPSVRIEAVKAIVAADTQASLDPLVKATSDNTAEVQSRATDGLVNFYVPGYIETGLTAPFKKVATSIKSRFTDIDDRIIDSYVEVRPDVIAALGKVARGGASMEARAGAARALGILRGKAALPDLLEALKSSDTEVNYEVLIALQKIKDTSVGPSVAFRLRDPVEKVQIAAVETTGILENKAALNQLRDVLDRSKSSKVKKSALGSIAMMPDPSMHSLYTYHLQDKDEGMRVAAMEGIARLRDAGDLPAMQQAFQNEKKQPGRLASAFALVALGQIEMKEFSPLQYLVGQLNSGGYRGVALAYLKELARNPAVRQSMYAGFQQTPTRDEKTGLAQVLAASGDRDSISYLETLSKDPDPEVDKEALRALQSIRARVG